MVDILKIKDENGDWVTVQAFQGQTGLTPHIQIGQVEAGATPSDAAASMSGTKEFPLLNLTLPKGDVGEVGIAVASVEPQTDQLVWIDTGTPANTKVIPEVDDTAINYVDTWSSAKIRDFIYPVGSIYLSVNSTSPAAIFGGTWEQIQDTFLLAAGSIYTAGSIGGEAEHQLIADELPALDGKFDSVLMDDGRSISFGGIVTGTLARSRSWSGASGNASYTATIAFGNDQPHNNMPPYLAIYVWKRTA